MPAASGQSQLFIGQRTEDYSTSVQKTQKIYLVNNLLCQLLLAKASEGNPPTQAPSQPSKGDASAGPAGAHVQEGAEESVCTLAAEPSRSSILGEKPWHAPHPAQRRSCSAGFRGCSGGGVGVGSKIVRGSLSGRPRGEEEVGRYGGEGASMMLDIDPDHVPLLLDDLLLERDVGEDGDEVCWGGGVCEFGVWV